jgi:drug/metabolite transporter (DMT)-like permease
VIFAFLAFQGALGGLAASLANTTSLMWLLMTGGSLFAFLSFWYLALKYLPVLKATSIFAIGGVVTATLNLMFLGKAVSLADAFALLIILAGALAAIGAADLSRSFGRIKDIVPSLME